MPGKGLILNQLGKFHIFMIRKIQVVDMRVDGIIYSFNANKINL